MNTSFCITHPKGIICQVVTIWALTWFIRYIYYWNSQFLNNVIFIKAKFLHHPLPLGDLSWFWLPCLDSSIFLLSKYSVLQSFNLEYTWCRLYLLVGYIYFLSLVKNCFRLLFRFYGVQRHFQQYFSYIVVVSFIDGGNQSTQWKPTTCRKSSTNFII